MFWWRCTYFCLGGARTSVWGGAPTSAWGGAPTLAWEGAPTSARGMHLLLLRGDAYSIYFSSGRCTYFCSWLCAHSFFGSAPTSAQGMHLFLLREDAYSIYFFSPGRWTYFCSERCTYFCTEGVPTSVRRGAPSSVRGSVNLGGDLFLLGKCPTSVRVEGPISVREVHLILFGVVHFCSGWCTYL